MYKCINTNTCFQVHLEKKIARRDKNFCVNIYVNVYIVGLSVCCVSLCIYVYPCIGKYSFVWVYMNTEKNLSIINIYAWRRGMDIHGKCGCLWEDQRKKSKEKRRRRRRRSMRIIMHLHKVMYMCHYMHKWQNKNREKMEKWKYSCKNSIMQSLVHISLIWLLSSDFDRG